MLEASSRFSQDGLAWACWRVSKGKGSVQTGWEQRAEGTGLAGKVKEEDRGNTEMM